MILGHKSRKPIAFVSKERRANGPSSQPLRGAQPYFKVLNCDALSLKNMLPMFMEVCSVKKTSILRPRSSFGG